MEENLKFTGNNVKWLQNQIKRNSKKTKDVLI